MRMMVTPTPDYTHKNRLTEKPREEEEPSTQSSEKEAALPRLVLDELDKALSFFAKCNKITVSDLGVSLFSKHHQYGIPSIERARSIYCLQPQRGWLPAEKNDLWAADVDPQQRLILARNVLSKYGLSPSFERSSVGLKKGRMSASRGFAHDVENDPHLSRDFLVQLWIADRKMEKSRKKRRRKMAKYDNYGNEMAKRKILRPWKKSSEATPPSQSVSGLLKPASPEEALVAPLLARSNLLITRDIEWANLVLGFEQENRYAVVDVCYPQSPVGFIREQSNVIARQLLRLRRPFVAYITDAMGNELFRVRRPFWWITSSIYAEINGKIFTDAGQYVIRFGSSDPSSKSAHAAATHDLEVARLTLSERAVAVALAISLDNDYFSRHGGWDWYNLEKSKRVKAFRCGKSAAADHQRSKSSGPTKKESGIASESLANNSGKPGNAKLNTGIKDEIIGNPLKAKDGNLLISEDDHSEATPRMRGLRDFGLRTAPLKRKLPSSVDSDSSVIPMADNHFQAHPVGAPNMERTNHANGVDEIGAISLAKRSRNVHLPAESSDSLDDKELPPNQINMLSSQFEDDGGHPHDSSLNEQNSSSGFMENVESDSSETDSFESECDSSETEPDVAGKMTVFPGTSMPTEAERNALRQPEAPGEHGSTSSEDADELAFSGEMSHLYPDDPFLANEAVSKWQLKGKRNIRHLTKKSVDGAEGKLLNGPFHGTYQGIKGTLGQRSYGFDDGDLGRKYIQTQMVGLDNGHYSYASRTLGDRAEHFNPIVFGRHPYGGRARSMLVDVDVKVQASYQKERVPIVSLMSKLNGQAIIGHPIQIEALEDGSSETLISTSDYHGNEAVEHDGNTSLPPAWRTARRTNFRVPRPHLSLVLGADDAEDPPFIDQEGRSPFRKSSVGSFSHKASLVRKSLPHISRPSMDRKFPRKLAKKACLSSNQKTRTLSSIAVQQNFRSKPLHYTSTSQMDGLIKPETSRPTTVACIPVKLVFSRLLEKINRPPLKAACKAVISTGMQRDNHHS
ncbi:hypothetical protein GH714_004000 [Hevea brasiliensis]|uniref:Phospholipid scramblase n=1 Tax=Hevea brasiliensis TaxID=3981 RepID=A0A6A6KGJ3_HEVBR|nr:hypothetical protein GH714_004000 [Hevea brasiliensis]